MKAGKSGLKFIGLGVLLFVMVLAALEIALAILNTLQQNLPFGAYAITLIVLPVVALLVTNGIIIAFYIRTQKTQKLIDSLNRVAEGDYSAEIEYSRRDTYANIYKNFNKMTHELKAVKTLREDFIHNFSHEIKTPLFSIQGFANLILDGGLTQEEHDKFLKIISEEAGRLWRLADSTLTLSKLENQQLPGERQPLRLDVEINDSIILLEHEWEEKGIEVSADLEAIRLLGDKEMLRQVWVNLLSNAVKFTPSGGRIEVGLKRVGNLAVVTFRDSGCGISVEDMPRIFDKYYRSEGAKSTEGNGLGLAICKRICALSGGDVTCQNNEGGGATFTVTLPIQ